MIEFLIDLWKWLAVQIPIIEPYLSVLTVLIGVPWGVKKIRDFKRRASMEELHGKIGRTREMVEHLPRLLRDKKFDATEIQLARL